MRREPTYILTVGPVPGRMGEWLGVESCNSGQWRALAKFRNQEAADEFLKIARASGWTNGDGEAKP